MSAEGSPRPQRGASDWHTRIGLLVPHFDVVPEFEFNAMAPAGVSIHAARVPFGVSAGATVVGADAIRAFAEPPYVDQAVEGLAASPIDVIVYAFTSSSYLGGADADRSLRDRLERKSNGIPVVIPCLAAVAALRELAVRKLALVSPPWFPPEADEQGAAYFAAQGAEVVYHAPAVLEHAELPDGQLDIEPHSLHEWVIGNMPPGADAVLIGGNGFRAVHAIESLESELRCPVLTANQVALWQACRLAGRDCALAHFGRLLERP